MTREEQMKAAAKCECADELGRITFCIGALWADRNPKSPWISVKDRLPNEGEHIWFTYKYTFATLSEQKRAYGDIYYPEPYITDRMDFWMPIPDLPMED